MSSPRTANARKVAGRKPNRRTAPRSKPAPAPAVVDDASAAAKRLAAAIGKSLAGGRTDAVSAEALQALMAALCRLYAAQAEAGATHLPIPGRGGVTATDVMVVAGGLLKGVDLAVFELGMWQSWTGR